MIRDVPTVVASLAVIVAVAVFWFVVFRKAGYESRTSVLTAIGMFIPLVNLGLAIYFATAVWPIQIALDTARAHDRTGIVTDPRKALLAAIRLETRGDAAGAIAVYEQIMRGFPGSEPAKDAEASIRTLQARINRT